MTKVVYEKINNTEGALKAVVDGKKVKLSEPTIDANDEKSRAYKVIEALESVSSFGGAIEVYASKAYKSKQTGEDKNYEVKGKLFEREPKEGANKREIVFKADNGFEFSAPIKRFSKEENADLVGKISVKTVSEFLNKTVKYSDEGVDKVLSNPLKDMDKLKLTPVKFLDPTNENDKKTILAVVEASKVTEGKLVEVTFAKGENGVEVSAAPAKKEVVAPEVKEEEVGGIDR